MAPLGSTDRDDRTRTANGAVGVGGHYRVLVEGRFGASHLMSWARLLKRVFALDLEHCPNCGGELKTIGAILEQPVIEKILTHLGLEAQPPPRARAREPGPHHAG